ncbi:PREDICTED: VQ [Prunus dulcis]|uniref:PREDICTED: VQ n=1 Tax=Prunus dulcis TaxID=3755 RepID=A0A5E4EM21_PRUDU|nr:VQ motif-containing protein 4 [Prunus dulcis]VVA16717.1 PREDICTED: VQ [Prunus dulcis]
MEFTSRPQEIREKQPYSYSPINSPRSNGTNTNTKTNTNSSVCSSNTNNNNSNNNNSSGVQIPTTPKLTTPRSDPNPYPTTFVQADTTNFKHVVQMLTGSSETVSHQSSPKPTTTHHHHHPHSHQDPTVLPSSNKSFNIPPIKTAPPKKQGFKLYERRSTNLKNTLMINTLMPNFPHQASGFSPRHQEILSPSLLDFPSLTLSPVTPLNDDPFDKSSSSPSLGNSSSEEDRAIAEKGFYLHPSPRTTTTPRDPEPRLLPLFPVTSPRVSGSSS